METIRSAVTGTVIARLERGEDLYESLAKIVEEMGIGSGCLQLIGAVSRANLGIFEDGEYKWVVHEGPLEISSCTGNITIREGKPFIHCHAVMNDHKGNVLGGHVGSGCIIDPTAEVHVTVYQGEVTRRYDDDTGLWLMDI